MNLKPQEGRELFSPVVWAPLYKMLFLYYWLGAGMGRHKLVTRHFS